MFTSGPPLLRCTTLFIPYYLIVISSREIGSLWKCGFISPIHRLFGVFGESWVCPSGFGRVEGEGVMMKHVLRDTLLNLLAT